MQGCSGGNLDRVAGRGFRSCTPAFANFSPPVGGEGSSMNSAPVAVAFSGFPSFGYLPIRT